MKILSVDDSAIIRKIIQGAVDMIGLEFLGAENGQEATNLLMLHEDVGLVILDWNMPVKDGFTTLLEIKQDPKLSHIPVMMVTTESEKNNVIRAIQAGACQYVTKPFTQEDLINKILQTVGN